MAATDSPRDGRPPAAGAPTPTGVAPAAPVAQADLGPGGSARPPGRSIGEILRSLGPWRRPVLLTTAMAGLAAVFEAGALVLIVALADVVTSDADRFTGSIGPVPVDLPQSALFVAAPAAIVLSTALLLWSYWRRSVIAASWSKQRRGEMVHAFLATDWSVQARDRAGNLQAVAGWVGESQQMLVQLVNAGRGLVGVVVLLGTAALVNAWAALGIVVVGALLFVVLRPLVTASKRWSGEAALLNRVRARELGELSEAARDVRTFDVADRFARQSDATMEAQRVADLRRLFLVAAVTPLYQAAAFGLLVAALGLAASQGGEVDVAVLGAVVLLVLRSVSYGQQLQSAYGMIHTFSPALELYDAAMAELLDARASDGTGEIGPVARVEFRDVSYSYDDRTLALQDLSLTLHRGEMVGLVGPSGSGKSTLAQLLLRLRQPGTGQILADGQPLEDLAAASWYRQVSLVPQHVALTYATLRENVRFYRDHVSDEDVLRAVHLAGLDGLVASLDLGLDTPLGRDQRDLSGGQAQRIGIARALAGRPSVLILDEPTSALDHDTEAHVHATLEALRSDHLIVAIAHRLSTLAICDRVVSMVDGRVEADVPAAGLDASEGFLRRALAVGAIEDDAGAG